jgi:hypothetical protein
MKDTKLSIPLKRRTPLYIFKLAIRFYTEFGFAAGLMTVICLILFWQNGWMIFGEILWLKIISLGLIYFIKNSLNKQFYYFYFNLGASRTQLWGISLSVDLLFFFLLIIFLSQFR